MNNSTFDLFLLVVLLVLGVVMPLLGMWDYKRLLRWVDEGRPDARTKTYTWIIVMQWGLVAAFGAWWLLQGRDLSTLGLTPAAGGWQWLAIGLGLAGTAFVIGQMVVVLRSEKELAKARDQIGDLMGLVPQTKKEDRLFAAVSVTAGVCEEILYRGVLLAAFIPVVGMWPAVGLSSAIFGLGHAYQGLAGLGKTTLIGVVMALLAVYSGSIFVPMLLHAVVDITSGKIMGAAARTEPMTAEPA